MKKLLLFFLLFLGAVSLARAQGFRWQGVANDAAGNPVTQAVTLKFSILKNGAAVYVENQNPIAPVGGQISATVGGGTATTGTFAGIDWANGPFSLNVKMKIGSGAELDMGTSLILPVPMALWAANSGGGNGGWTLNGANIFRQTGNVGIGTNAPGVKLHVVESDNTKYTAAFDNGGGAGKGLLVRCGYFPNSAAQPLWVGNYDGNKSYLMVRGDGNIGIGTTTPLEKLHVEGGGIYLKNSAPRLTFRNNGGHEFFWEVNPNGTFHLFDWVSQKSKMTFDQSGTVVINPDGGNVGIGILNPTEKLEVNGRTKTKTLEIVGGADLAESFDIQSVENEPAPEPGMLVSIDPDHPGQLKICTETYDRKIAGVISGAGGIQPGMVMGQEESIANGKYPVAMVGRVYVQADASFGKIEPGDLLTTSSLPGVAMKVGDHSLAQGAMIGKAMTSLNEGRGLVLVLVNLQ